MSICHPCLLCELFALDHRDKQLQLLEGLLSHLFLHWQHHDWHQDWRLDVSRELDTPSLLIIFLFVSWIQTNLTGGKIRTVQTQLVYRK